MSELSVRPVSNDSGPEEQAKERVVTLRTGREVTLDGTAVAL